MEVTPRDARVLLGGAATLVALGLVLFLFSWSIVVMMPQIKESATGLETQTQQGQGGTIESPLAPNVYEVIVQLQILTAAMIVLAGISAASGVSLALTVGGTAFGAPGVR